MTLAPAVLLLLAASEAGLPETSGPIDRLAWLAGCWEMQGEGRVTREEWMPPLGGTMLGMSRTVAAGRTSQYEYLRIEDRAGQLAYVAAPSGRRETSFAQVEMTEEMVVFENTAHDFPQRVSYRRLPDGRLLARIEGPRSGRTQVVDFPMKRVPCEGASK